MGRTLLYKVTGDRIRRLKRFDREANAGRASVTLLWSKDKTALLGVFADHEAAGRFIAAQGLGAVEMVSEAAKV